MLPRETFEVGDRVSYSPYTDRYPCTVVGVSASGKTLTLREDDARVIDPDLQPGGFAAVHGPRQKWECFENPDGSVFKATLRKDGRYRRVHAGNSSPPIRKGWSYYRDPNF